MTMSEAQQRRRQMVIGLAAALVVSLLLAVVLGGVFSQLAFLVVCASVAYGGLLARARRVVIERAVKVRTIDRLNARREAYQAPAPGEAYGDEPYGGDADDYGFGFVEETRVGQKTNYDKLTMEIWTNGTVTPEMALVEAAKILRKHLNPFVSYTSPGEGVHLPAAADVFAIEAPLSSRLGMLVNDLKLSLRANNCLEAEGIKTLRELVGRSREELLEVRNFGDTTLHEIEAKLRELGLELGMQVPDEAAV
jgi:hypothetical protein